MPAKPSIKHALVKHPLSWYVAKLEEGFPFASLLYGDGEFLVASRDRTGLMMQNGEVVTKQLEYEMRASLVRQDPRIIRATDPSILDWRDYGGRDVASVRAISERIERLLTEVEYAGEWVDGTVWDEAVQAGELGPLLRVLSKRLVMLVGNRQLAVAEVAKRWWFMKVPSLNACADLDHLEPRLVRAWKPSEPVVFLVCMGLGAIPLIMRLLDRFPNATFLDLGSTFDVFAGIGGERGWRAELYADPEKLKALIDKNLGGAGKW